MRARAGVVTVSMMVGLSGCYASFTEGPAFHASDRPGYAGTGNEWTLTGGFEGHFDDASLLNPLAAKTRVAVGITAFGSNQSNDGATTSTTRSLSTPSTTTVEPIGARKVSAGIWELELGRTLHESVWSTSGGHPVSGSLLRAVGSVGRGSGSMRSDQSDSDVAVWSGRLGVEYALHTGGGSINSIGIAFGTGVRFSDVQGDPAGHAQSISPYLSVTIEGGVLLQLWAFALQAAGGGGHSPLVLDLAGDGVQASSVDAGVRFDLLETGRSVLTAWPSGDDAMLALDRDGDGRITNGGELFGDSRRAGGKTWANGFASLAALDQPADGGNGDGRIDARDASFAALRLWRDANHDGVSQPGELEPLSAEGIVAIELAYVESDARDAAGNRLAQVGSFVRRDSSGMSRGAVIDVWFQYRP